jgi:hypothetical protein
MRAPLNRLLLCIALCLPACMAAGQVVDSGKTAAWAVDSTVASAPKEAVAGIGEVRRDEFLSGKGHPGPYGDRVGPYMASHPYFHTSEKPVGLPHLRRNVRDMDWVFYLFAGSLLLLGLTRVVFPGYAESLFRGFFGSAATQKKMGEGMSRYGIASLWMNLLFLLNGSIFLYFLLRPYGMAGLPGRPWQWIAVCMLMLSAIYVFKYSVLLLAGWIFGKVRQAHDYMSVVFTVNRLAAILLLFSSLPLALAGEGERRLFLPVVWLILSILLEFRMSRSFEFFRKSFRIGFPQFLLLFLSFEVLPLLLLRKALWDLYL